VRLGVVIVIVDMAISVASSVASYF